MRALAGAWLVIFYPAIVAGVFIGLIAFALSALSSSLVRPGPEVSSDPAAIPSGADMPHGSDGGSAVRASESPLGERVGVCMEIAACDDPGSASAVVALPTNSPTRDSVPIEPPPTVTRARTDARGAIAAAAAEFGQDPEFLTAVAMCESSLRPDAIGDGGAAVGLFQFHIWRWNLNAPRLGYLDDLRADPVASSRVAAYAFSTGQRSAWTCARP